jgi:predicted TPR repeat methyltransferase
MSYRLLAHVYDRVAPRVSRYRSPALVTSVVLERAPEGCELLDVGIGTGLSIAPYLRTTRFKRIVGIDPSSAMLHKCRAKFPGVELHHGTIETVSFDLATRFDIIQSCGAVEHIKDLVPLMARVSALLKPGGYFVFTYEPELPFSRWQSKRARHLGTWGFEPVFRRTPDEMQELLKSAGLVASEDIEFKAYLGLIHHLVVARARRSP